MGGCCPEVSPIREERHCRFTDIGFLVFLLILALLAIAVLENDLF